ncbi:MAG TPA: ATP-binding cassette domain-containing protein [Planctomycetota bacterium]|nr:ATP-binding cassette domain-containing protein [Planctomycetota bacterium]
MIEVRDLSKSFGSVKALDRVSFRVEEGQILGFLGPNGAGKSTTMRILTGFLPGDSGAARVAGYDVRADSLEVRRRTGYLPEGVPLYPEMRVSEYLWFRARLKGVPRSRRRGVVDQALDDAGVTEARRRVVGTLSRGYRQRVGLASALLGEPQVLILDEPTVGLDPEQVRQFRQLLQRVGHDRTVVLSTHILSEVELVCTDVVIIHAGRILVSDTASNVRRKFGAAERTVADVAGPADRVEEALARIPHAARVAVTRGGDFHRFTIEAAAGEDLREAVYSVVRDGGWRLRELRREAMSLEEAFVAILSPGGKARA